MAPQRQAMARTRASPWRRVSCRCPPRSSRCWLMVQLELVGIRPSSGDALVLQHQLRSYWVRRDGNAVVIRNADGEELRGEAQRGGPDSLQIDHPKADHPYVKALMQDAARAMGLAA